MRWEREPMDNDYLDRLEQFVQVEGEATTKVYRFDGGAVAIWQVEIRGDDVLELIRLARAALETDSYQSGDDHA